MDGFDNGVVPRMRRRCPRGRLDAGFSMVCSELPEVVSTRGGGVSLVGCGVRTSASSCSSFCGSNKKSNKVIRLCARERGREEERIRPPGLTVLAGIRENGGGQEQLRRVNSPAWRLDSERGQGAKREGSEGF